MSESGNREQVQTVIVGGGQAGLSVGYHLMRLGLPFLILEKRDRIGDSWRARWESLRLFTPARFDGLDGMPFPAKSHSFPTKDEMAGYLEEYAERFRLPVRTGTRVERLSRESGKYLVETTEGEVVAENVVVAMSNFQQPRQPPHAVELDPSIVQLHSSEYQGPHQLREGPVLLVGAGNSGAEIALEVSKSHETWLAGRHPGHLPFRIEGRIARVLIRPIFRLVFHRLLSVRTPLGRRMRPKALRVGGPLIRVKPEDLARAGVRRVPRVTGTRDGLPLLEDGRTLEVSNVIWCNGFDPGFSWIDLPVLGEVEPEHLRGVVPDHPGLFFVGLHFLTALSSVMIHGVGRDARYIAERIAERPRARAGATAAAPAHATAGRR